jgi:hypothetical protein
MGYGKLRAVTVAAKINLSNGSTQVALPLIVRTSNSHRSATDRGAKLPKQLRPKALEALFQETSVTSSPSYGNS